MLAVTGCSRADPPDTTPPAAPTGLTAVSGSSTTVHVMWRAATDDRAVTGYQVLQDGRPVKDLPATTLMTDVTGLAPGTRHAFAVRARDAAGNTSPATPAATATTLRATAEDREPPTAPRALRAAPDGTTAATLAWTASRDDTRVTAYDVYQAGVRVHTAPGTATTARLTGLRPGTAYSFTLRARDAAENSSPDSPRPTSPPPPPPARPPTPRPSPSPPPPRTARSPSPGPRRTPEPPSPTTNSTSTAASPPPSSGAPPRPPAAPPTPSPPRCRPAPSSPSPSAPASPTAPGATSPPPGPSPSADPGGGVPQAVPPAPELPWNRGRDRSHQYWAGQVPGTARRQAGAP
ncbi:fibronectin type III domain-containing protein [Streptomyces filamentosus]|uniref:fibronectin type III domain-containing protein n=1 Tax=Streptomyces filamentosus TaxID=67294 RepID=UPI0023564197|nr:fibronectin type III domain-containing protein [Streptomyces filamentosus]